MNQNIVEYKVVLEECLVECKKMLEFETEKRRALLDSDMNNLSAVLQSQQATMMKLENIEKKRILNILGVVFVFLIWFVLSTLFNNSLVVVLIIFSSLKYKKSTLLTSSADTFLKS